MYRNYIRKSLGMKAHWVTEVVETEGGWVARVDRFGNRRLKCGHYRGEIKMTRGRRPERRWRDLSIRDKAFWIVYRPFRVSGYVSSIILHIIGYRRRKDFLVIDRPMSD